MIKWGTTFGSHDGALAVFQDDELVFASDAERWSRKKNDPIIPENLIKFAEDNNFNFPYLFDENQNVAQTYDAVCTPDFFGFNENLELRYRGRIRGLKDLKPIKEGESDLLKAMKLIAETGKGPKDQIPSMGCNIKWKK